MSSDITHKDRADDSIQGPVVTQPILHVARPSDGTPEATDMTPSPLHPVGTHHRKRAPLTSVACQDCRRRKTKCDGKKPVCSNCSKRGGSHCVYDLEPNQSRVAAYKQKIEHQIKTIHALENEVRRLKENPRSLTLDVHNPTSNSGGGLPIEFLMNPVPEPRQMDSPGHEPRQHQRRQTLPAFDQLQTQDSHGSQREFELLSHQRSLEAENRTLRELVLLLNSVKDRDLAQSMAQEISDNGVTDNLLSRAQQMVSSQSHTWTHLSRRDLSSGEISRQESRERSRHSP